MGGPLDSMQNPCIARSGMGRVVLDDNCFENKFLPQKLVGNTFDTSTFVLTWLRNLLAVNFLQMLYSLNHSLTGNHLSLEIV